jgi:hypothetical protein
MAIPTWSGNEFSDPCVGIRAKGDVHPEVYDKEEIFYNPMFEQYFSPWIIRISWS